MCIKCNLIIDTHPSFFPLLSLPLPQHTYPNFMPQSFLSVTLESFCTAHLSWVPHIYSSVCDVIDCSFSLPLFPFFSSSSSNNQVLRPSRENCGEAQASHLAVHSQWHSQPVHYMAEGRPACEHCPRKPPSKYKTLSPN